MNEFHITYLHVFVHNCWGAFPQMCEETETKKLSGISKLLFSKYELLHLVTHEN
jgi:hypothetical protein